jgi:WD40 repeat protein
MNYPLKQLLQTEEGRSHRLVGNGVNFRPSSVVVRRWGHREGFGDDARRAIGARLLLGSRDGQVRVYEAASDTAVARSGGRTEGALRVRLAAPGHRGAVHGVSLADDCSKGVSCGGDGQVALWDIHSLSKVSVPQISSAGRMHADMPLAGLVCDSQWLLQHLVLRHVW